MEKNKLKLKQLLIIAWVLKLNPITCLGIELLAQDFIINNPNYELYGFNSGRMISEQDGYIEFSGQNLKELLGEIESTTRNDIIKYVQSFDFDDFILRKIKHYYSVYEESLNKIFSQKEMEKLKGLINEGYLNVTYDNDIPYLDYKEISLSNKGELKLFKKDNKKEIEDFTTMLKLLKYDVTLLDDFLLTQDLSLPAWAILNVSDLDRFCNYYDRASKVNEDPVEVLAKKKI